MDFETFAVTYHGRVVAALTLYCGDRWVAEELAQDALVRALERWKHVAEMAEPGAWLYRVAMNLANSRFRRKKAEKRALTKMGTPAEAVPGIDSAQALAVRAAVAKLPPGQKAAVVCRYFLGYSVDETSRLLGISAGSVKSNTHRGLATLRKQFDVADFSGEGEVHDVA